MIGVHNKSDKSFTTQQIFSRSPKSFNDELNFDRLEKMCKKSKNVFIHSSYMINFARPFQGKYHYMKKLLDDDIKVSEFLGKKFKGLVVHSGCIVDQKRIDATENFVNQINELSTRTKVILETSACEGTRLFNRLSDAEFFKLSPKIKWCIDTAHVFQCGYDISTVAGLIDYFLLFDEKIGLEKITLIHLNDSKYELRKHKDVHETIGKGKLFGFNESQNVIANILGLSEKMNWFVILETPSKNILNDHELLLSINKKYELYDQLKKLIDEKKEEERKSLCYLLGVYIDEPKKTKQYSNLMKLTKVPNIGIKKASELLKLNLTLKDLPKNLNLLTDAQILGLKYYKKLKRVPRDVIDYIHDSLTKLKVEHIVAGSYRRGALSSGDVDILIMNQTFDTLDQLMEKENIENLGKYTKGKIKSSGIYWVNGFITQIDFVIIKKEQLGTQLLYFTGSKQFNVKIRGDALSKGYSLNEYGLTPLHGDKKLIEFSSEKEVFKHLGLQFVQPEAR